MTRWASFPYSPDLYFKMKFPLKFILSALSGAVLFSSNILAQTAEESSIPKVDTAPVIDASIDQIWHARAAFPIATVQWGAVEGDADLSAEWYGLWDDTNLYFLIDITDQTLDATSGTQVWQNDVIEVYFNMDNVKPGGGNGHSGDNYQYTFFWDHPGEQNGAYGDWTGVEWAQMQTAKGYRIEVKMPWTSLTTLTIEEGFDFGFDIAINDNDGNSNYDSVTYWYNSSSPLYGNIDGAGTVYLGGDFDGNYPPSLDQIDVQIATEGVSSSISVNATDFNQSDQLTISANDLPGFASVVDNGDGTARVDVNAQPGDVGIYYFDLVVDDGALSSALRVTLIVKDPNVDSQIPEFTPVDEISVIEGDLEEVLVTVTDLDSLNVDITAVGELPGFVSLTDNGDKTATVSINPAFGDAGNHSIHLLATDEADNTDELSISIVVGGGDNRTEFYCDPVNGNMDNPGSPQEPWGSLEAVFEAGKLFKPGDTIFLMDGYHGEVSVSSANTDFVYIKPADGASPTLAGISFGGSSAYWHLSGVTISRSFLPEYATGTMAGLGGDYIVVSDCEIYSVPDISGWSVSDWLAKATTGASLSGQHCLLENSTVRNIKWGVFMGGRYGTVRGCTIRNYSGDGLRPEGDYTTIEDCYIADNYKVDSNHDDAIQSYSNGPGGVGSSVVTGVTVRRNTIIQTTDPDRPLQGGLQGIGLFDGFFDDWVIENNVILVTNHHGIGIYGARRCKILNNTVLDSSGSATNTWIGVFPHKNGELSSDNLVRNNISTSLIGAQSFGTGDHNYRVSISDFDSYFVDYPNDLRLASGSPAIDAGSNTEAPELDRTGLVRLSESNTVVDAGAFEFASWRGHQMSGGWAFTGLKYFGWVYVAYGNWIYSPLVGEWVYSPEAYFSGSGGWAYFTSYQATASGWFFSSELNTWAFGSGNHWGYVLNTGN